MPNRLESVRIGPYRCESAHIGANEQKKKRANWHIGGASSCRHESGAGAAALELHPCFLGFQ